MNGLTPASSVKVVSRFTEGSASTNCVIARPERKLVLDVLGFRDINRRVPRAFAAFVLQVKGKHRGGLIFVADHEHFGAKFVFEIGPKFVDGFRDRFPSRHPGVGVEIRRERDTDRAHQIGVHGHRCLQTAQDQGGEAKAGDQGSLVSGLKPVMGCQYPEADESGSGPNRIAGLVQGNDQVNKQERPTEGQKQADFTVLKRFSDRAEVARPIIRSGAKANRVRVVRVKIPSSARA